MRDKELYQQILGIQAPWKVSDKEMDIKAGKVKVHVEQKLGTKQTCPKCGARCPGYDRRRRQWQHLDTCQLKTLLIADLPRVQCAEHGVVSVHVPWSEPGSDFTVLYEALVIDWLQEASIQAVSRQLSFSWNAIDGIMQRAVKRGLERRQVAPPKHIGVDETSFRKRHDYVTVVSAEGKVLHVANERKKGSKYDWLTNPGNLSHKRQRSFKLLRESTLKTARAWAIKDLAMRLWSDVSRTWAEKRWKQWLSWALRCRLEPVKKVAKTIKEHLWGILNAIILKVSNGPSESINSRIKTIKIRSRGFQNKARFRNAIYCHLGGLVLYPQGVCR